MRDVPFETQPRSTKSLAKWYVIKERAKEKQRKTLPPLLTKLQLRAKFVEQEKVWVAVPGQKGKVIMSVVDSNQDPSTGKWSYELKDSQGETYYENGNKWIREKDLEAGNGKSTE